MGIGKMANYYPLVSKAVARNASSEARQAVYDRVREAMLNELRKTDPPFSDFEIMRERLALEDAVSKVEDESAERDRDAFVSNFGDLADDADDVETAVTFMMVSGSATGRLNRVWRCAWR
jgi:hypothetical protein